MGYRKIHNLYKCVDVLMFKECYAMEKIHGTSAHITWAPSEPLVTQIRLFPGGIKYDSFAALFDKEELRKKFAEHFGDGFRETVTVFGEAYGGKCQAMSDVYGKNLKFVAFEVKIGESWLAVPKAENVSVAMGLEFVHYEQGPATIEWLDAQRDKPSVQAVRNGLGDDKVGEGIVVRPLIEVKKNNGERIMAKHKRADFRETKKPRKVTLDPAQLEVLEEASKIAEEWVTEMRLTHVMDKVAAKFNQDQIDMAYTGIVVRTMIKDVKLESEGEVVWSKAAEKAIGRVAAQMYKKRVMTVMA